MNWRQTAKRNLFVHCFSRDAARDNTRIAGALKSYEVVMVSPGTWYVRTSAGINRVLADVRSNLGEDSGARVLIIDATEDQWASWPASSDAWPELDELKFRYGWSQVDPQGRRLTFERLTPVSLVQAPPRTARLAHRRD